MDIKAGSTDQSVSFAAFTTSTGAAVTVTSATAGLSLWYRRGTAGAKTAISPSDLATLETAHTDGGIKVIEGQDHRLDLPDAAVAAGVDRIEWGGSATGITIDGGQANLIGQATTGSVGTPLTSQQTQDAAAAAIAAAGYLLSDADTGPTRLVRADELAEVYTAIAELDWTARTILSGTVDTVVSNSDFTIAGDFGAVDNMYKFNWLIFTDGQNRCIGRMIGRYNASTKQVQFVGAGVRGSFPDTVEPGDSFYLAPNSDVVAGLIGLKNV